MVDRRDLGAETDKRKGMQKISAARKWLRSWFLLGTQPMLVGMARKIASDSAKIREAA